MWQDIKPYDQMGAPNPLIANHIVRQLTLLGSSAKEKTISLSLGQRLSCL